MIKIDNFKEKQQPNFDDELQVYSKKVTTSSLHNDYIDSSHIKLMISSSVLDFIGLCSRTTISFGEHQKVAFNSVEPLVLDMARKPVPVSTRLNPSRL